MLDARFPAAKSFHDLDRGGKPDEKTRVDMNGNVKRSTLKSLTDSVSSSRRELLVKSRPTEAKRQVVPENEDRVQNKKFHLQALLGCSINSATYEKPKLLGFVVVVVVCFCFCLLRIYLHKAPSF